MFKSEQHIRLTYRLKSGAIKLRNVEMAKNAAAVKNGIS